jgi:hypothetical protein
LISNSLIKFLNFYTVSILLSFSLVNCIGENIDDRLISAKKVYLIYLVTDSKFGMISSDYNVNNSDYTHVGFLMKVKDVLMVYHVLPSKQNSDFKVESLSQFLNPTVHKVKDYSIYEVKGIDHDQTLFLLDRMQKEKILFDKKIELHNDKFYCSELVCYILNKVDGSFSCELYLNDHLLPFDKLFLDREVLKYYPVDGLLGTDKFLEVEI